MTPTDKLAAKVAALDIFNQAIQREIESIPGESIQLELAQIKFQVNQQFYIERRNGENTVVSTLHARHNGIDRLPHDDPGTIRPL